MKKITDIFKEKKHTLSFEFYPPKDEIKIKEMFKTIDALKKYNPDFISVTYGAGGSTRELTLEISEQIQKKYKVPVMHHLTCITHTTEQLKNAINKIKEKNIRNILVLRGDIPANMKLDKESLKHSCYAYQLCSLVRQMHGDFFSIGVAGFPEGHVNSPDKETDSRYLKMKIDAGGQFIITQLFFESELYVEYTERIKKEGVDVRIIPGILPLTGYESLVRFCGTCGASVPESVHNLFLSATENEEKEYKRKVDFTTRFCMDLLKKGAPGLHFYTLNKINPVSDILNNIKNESDYFG
jgi:methylenetetrahydrofolate reductase (NADPH)